MHKTSLHLVWLPSRKNTICCFVLVKWNVYIWLVFMEVFFFVGWDCPLGTVASSGLLYKPQMIDGGDCGAIAGMKIGRGNRSTRRKTAPAPLCPPQIPHDQTRARTPGRLDGKPATNSLSYGAAFAERSKACTVFAHSEAGTVSSNSTQGMDV
jgi:hypothetical protein